MNKTRLQQLLESIGQFTALDISIASFFSEQVSFQNNVTKDRFFFLVSWLSFSVRTGHVCIDLNDIQLPNFIHLFGFDVATELDLAMGSPSGQEWDSLCHDVPLHIISDDSTLSLMVKQGSRLYFQRFWQYEVLVAKYFKNTSCLKVNLPSSVKDLLSQFFPESSCSAELDWQKIAAITAITQPVAIISGGPGTGKTSTVSKILAILSVIHQEISADKPFKIITAAPTGKAAARLTESLSISIKSLPIDERTKNNLPVEGITLHRLLGARPDKQIYKYNKNNKLDVDVLLVDEASMIDLAMMASIIEALPVHTKLILLGDKEQLSSVEAGSVFGDLCQLSDRGYSQEYCNILYNYSGYKLNANHKTPTFNDNICLLQKSYRFGQHSGIGKLAESIKKGMASEALDILSHDSPFSDVMLCSYQTKQEYEGLIVTDAVAGYFDYLAQINDSNANPQKILSYFNQFRVLCAVKDGDFGVSGVNQLIEKSLQKMGRIYFKKNESWYIGRPVMILQNSASLGLYNGDIGIVLKEKNNKLKVYFCLSDGSVKGFSPYSLPECETAYAMTIHKSQGSEFSKVSVILPGVFTPILTRSLIYTAITRAKNSVSIYTSSLIVKKTIDNQIKRTSGLEMLLD